jgi:hypothetical protein
MAWNTNSRGDALLSRIARRRQPPSDEQAPLVGAGTTPRLATGAAMRCLALDVAAATTCAALADGGIASILLKGQGLARLLGVERHRRYNDVDILVAPSTFDAAQTLLQDLGYQPRLHGPRTDEWCHWYERPWLLPGPLPMTVDLHRGFAGVRNPETFWSALSASARRIELAGGSVAVPDAVGAALLVALHAARPGGSAKPGSDLTLALDVLPVSVWRAAADLARTVGATDAFALGLRQTDAGTDLAAAMGLPHRATAPEWIAARRGSGAGYSLAYLAALPTLRARWRYLCLILVPPVAAMRYHRPLSRRGPWLLALEYLVRAGQLTWRIPGGLRELRAARRAVNRSGHA